MSNQHPQVPDALIAAAVAGGKVGSGGWIRVPCPFCLLRTGKTDRRGSFGYLAGTGVYHCFKCGVAGKLRNTSTLSSEANQQVPDTVEQIRLPDGFEPLWREPALDALCAAPARRYLLKRRQVPKSTWKDVGIGVTLSGMHYGRIVVPIWAEDDETLLGWSARSWDDDVEREFSAAVHGMHLVDYDPEKVSMKYLYPKGMDRYHVLFNAGALRVETDEPALAVEGVFDALPYWPDGVAVLGKPSEGQLDALASAKRPVVVCLDGDAWEQGMMLSLRLKLENPDGRFGFVKLPPCTDPNEGIDPGWLREEARRSVAG